MSLPTDPISEAKDIAIAAIVGILLIVIIWLGYCKITDERQLAQDQVLILDLKTKNEKFEEAAIEQNARLAAINSDAQSRAAAAGIAIKEVGTQGAAAIREVGGIFVDTPGDDMCAKVSAQLKTYFRKPR